MLNKVMLIGNVGRDPEVRSAGGSNVANLSVATTESWKDRNSGEWKERAEWHKVVAWGALADRVRDSIGKGERVYVEGKLETRKWQDQSGQDRYTTEIRAERIVRLSGGPKETQGAPSDTQPDLDDEIPF